MRTSATYCYSQLSTAKADGEALQMKLAAEKAPELVQTAVAMYNGEPRLQAATHASWVPAFRSRRS